MRDKKRTDEKRTDAEKRREGETAGTERQKRHVEGSPLDLSHS